MPLAVGLDAVFQRYHWDYWQYVRTPEWLMQELVVVWEAESRADQIKQRRKKGQTGGPAAVPRNKEELIQQAKSAGMPLPPESVEQ